jgi:hypothetical protein
MFGLVSFGSTNQVLTSGPVFIIITEESVWIRWVVIPQSYQVRGVFLFPPPVETPSYGEGVAARQGCDGRLSNSGVTFLRRLQRAHAFRI